mgnify:CR=1 FL=1
MNFVRRCSNFFFGMECLGCGTTSEFLDPWFCPDCKAKLQQTGKEPPFPNENTACLFPLDSRTRRLVHALKYRSLSGVASYLVQRSSLVKGGVLADCMEEWAKPLTFIPVPLHPARYRERGYNQAERIASAMAVTTGGQVKRLLRRTNFKVSQTKLHREEREWNVAGAFTAVAAVKFPTHGTLVVVDDVFTTGATTGACVQALSKRSSLDVKVCTLLYDEPASAVMDFAADQNYAWDYR